MDGSTHSMSQSEMNIHLGNTLPGLGLHLPVSCSATDNSGHLDVLIVPLQTSNRKMISRLIGGPLNTGSSRAVSHGLTLLAEW